MSFGWLAVLADGCRLGADDDALRRFVFSQGGVYTIWPCLVLVLVWVLRNGWLGLRHQPTHNGGARRGKRGEAGQPGRGANEREWEGKGEWIYTETGMNAPGQEMRESHGGTGRMDQRNERRGRYVSSPPRKIGVMPEAEFGVGLGLGRAGRCKCKCMSIPTKRRKDSMK